MKTRLISAAIAIAIIVPLLIIGGKVFNLAVGLLAVLAYKEIVDLKVSHNKLPVIVQIIGLIDLLLIVFTSVNSADVSTIIRKGKYGHLETIGLGSTQTVLRVREVEYVNDTKLKFASGYKITLAPSSSISARTQDDSMCIPMAIYGINL